MDKKRFFEVQVIKAFTLIVVFLFIMTYYLTAVNIIENIQSEELTTKTTTSISSSTIPNENPTTTTIQDVESKDNLKIETEEMQKPKVSETNTETPAGSGSSVSPPLGEVKVSTTTIKSVNDNSIGGYRKLGFGLIGGILLIIVFDTVRLFSGTYGK